MKDMIFDRTPVNVYTTQAGGRRFLRTVYVSIYSDGNRKWFEAYGRKVYVKHNREGGFNAYLEDPQATTAALGVTAGRRQEELICYIEEVLEEIE